MYAVTMRRCCDTTIMDSKKVSEVIPMHKGFLSGLALLLLLLLGCGPGTGDARRRAEEYFILPTLNDPSNYRFESARALPAPYKDHLFVLTINWSEQGFSENRRSYFLVGLEKGGMIAEVSADEAVLLTRR